MKKISIDHLTVRNFKGVRALDVDFKGRDARISGRNESGKSTVFDGVLWLLFGRDSRNAANFDVKPVDGIGRPVVGSEPEVTATLDIDGVKRTLRRSLLEVWTTPKGQAEKVYSSDRGAYWIDDVPKSEGEYKTFVASILPEAQFKLITNPEEFMLKNTAEKRLVLLNIADNGVDEILADRFPEIVAALDGLTADDARKKFKTQKVKFDDELAGIPGRIEELTRQLDGANESDRLRFADEVSKLTAEAAAVNVQIAQDPKAALRADLKRADREIADIESDAEKKYRAAVKAATDASIDAQGKLRKAKETVARLEGLIPKYTETQTANAAAIEQLRADYKQVYQSKFVTPSDLREVCPSCGQVLPADQIAAAVQRAADHFSENKRRKLESIDADGKGRKVNQDDLTARIAEAEKELESARADVSKYGEEVTATNNQYADLEIAGVTCPPDMDMLRAARDAIKDKVDAPEAEQVKALREQLAGIESRKETAQRAIAKCDVVKTAKARIVELEARQRELGDKAVALNQRLMMVEQYVRERCHLLEESINARFITVKWRLFEELKGEGFRDVCTCMIPNRAGALVPYASANTGARVNAGMEIINVLSDAYGVAAPVFVENSESVDAITPTIGQQIDLFKPDPDVCDWDGLKVEFSGGRSA